MTENRLVFAGSRKLLTTQCNQSPRASVCKDTEGRAGAMGIWVKGKEVKFNSCPSFALASPQTLSLATTAFSILYNNELITKGNGVDFFFNLG